MRNERNSDFWAKMGLCWNLILKVGSFPNYCSKWPLESTSTQKSIFYTVFTLPFPSPCCCSLPCYCSLFPSLCDFFVLNPNPTSGPLKKTLELQNIKFKLSHNLLFGLCKVFDTFPFFFPSQNVGF